VTASATAGVVVAVRWRAVDFVSESGCVALSSGTAAAAATPAAAVDVSDTASEPVADPMPVSGAVDDEAVAGRICTDGSAMVGCTVAFNASSEALALDRSAEAGPCAAAAGGAAAAVRLGLRCATMPEIESATAILDFAIEAKSAAQRTAHSSTAQQHNTAQSVRTGRAACSVARGVVRGAAQWRVACAFDF
jgi:hypothetical protein